MPINMPAEAHCQENRGINIVNVPVEISTLSGGGLRKISSGILKYGSCLYDSIHIVCIMVTLLMFHVN